MLGTHAEQTCQVELPEFEGPLDLMLHLVKRHELSILEIPIAFVTEKYIAYLDLMRSLNIDIAGEYLLMAATLAYIKSRELLPRDTEAIEEAEGEEVGESKEELIRRLLEYQRYKEAAESLGDQPTLGRQVFPRGAPSEKVDGTSVELVEVGTFELLSALADVLKRKKIEMVYDVTIERVSIGDRINEIADLLGGPKSMVLFTDCFDLRGSEKQVRHSIVVTFLAILEMVRLSMVRVLQRAAEGQIYITGGANLLSGRELLEKESDTAAVSEQDEP